MLYIGIGAGVLVLILLFILLKRRQDEFESKFLEKYNAKNIRYVDKTAFLAAQKSKGHAQTRGMGYLVLTDDRLSFEMQLFDRSIEIPLENITHIGETRRMGGKSTGKLWLEVGFTDAHGSEDALALSVKDLPFWKNGLEKALREKD